MSIYRNTHLIFNDFQVDYLAQASQKNCVKFLGTLYFVRNFDTDYQQGKKVSAMQF